VLAGRRRRRSSTLEGVRDQTNVGYLLHLLQTGSRSSSTRWTADFSAAVLKEISGKISAHLIGLGVTPRRDSDPARDGDGVAERRGSAVRGDHRGRGARCRSQRARWKLALRLPVQAIYKFDDRRIVAGRVESGHLAAGDEIVIMPAGKIARIKTVESWPVTPLKGSHGAGRSVGITLDRELFIERGDVIAHAVPPRATHGGFGAHFLAARQALAKASILVRPAPGNGANVVAIEKAVDPGEPPARRQGDRAQHVGEIDISLAQPMPPIPTDNPRPDAW
jgi:bifunctional enzyme CysN/CysC